MFPRTLQQRALRLAAISGWLWGAATPIMVFVGELGVSSRTGIDPVAFSLLAVSSLAWVASTLRMALSPRVSMKMVAKKSLFATLWLVETFSLAYWDIGTKQNFNGRLTHLDTVYITLGNLTTVGSGSLVPQSEAGRLLVTLQYAVDLIFVVIVLGTIVSQLATRRSR